MERSTKCMKCDFTGTGKKLYYHACRKTTCNKKLDLELSNKVMELVEPHFVNITTKPLIITTPDYTLEINKNVFENGTDYDIRFKGKLNGYEFITRGHLLGIQRKNDKFVFSNDNRNYYILPFYKLY